MNKFKYAVFIFSPFGHNDIHLDSNVISRHRSSVAVDKTISAWNGRACIGWKKYDGEKLGDDVNTYLRDYS